MINNVPSYVCVSVTILTVNELMPIEEFRRRTVWLYIIHALKQLMHATLLT